jgi:carbon-monoxide dehydrogenase small subunit
MLISARDLLLRKTGLDETDIRREMAGNLCRCTGYIGIIRAIYGVMSEGVTQADGPRADGYLGPAPGPGARGFIEAGPVAAERAETGKSAPLPARAEAREAARPAIDVIVGQMSQTDGFTEIPQHFILPHPPEKAWLLLSDLRAAAAAMPGAELDEGGDGERISGRMSVRLGPIRPSFAGEARVTKDAAARRVEIEGAGRDKRGASTARGRIAYRLSEAEGGAATRVDVVISYKLSGMLAQFGRPDLVRDVVRRLAANFAQNIDARLAGVEAFPAGEREGGVNLLALIWSIVTSRVASFWRRATGRAQPPR